MCITYDISVGPPVVHVGQVVLGPEVVALALVVGEHIALGAVEGQALMPGILIVAIDKWAVHHELIVPNHAVNTAAHVVEQVVESVLSGHNAELPVDAQIQPRLQVVIYASGQVAIFALAGVKPIAIQIHRLGPCRCPSMDII